MIYPESSRGDDPTNPNPPIKTQSTQIYTPCLVSQDGSVITVEFTANCGYVTISLVDSFNNIVYETSMIGSVDSSMAINTAGWTSGTYILVVTNDSGAIFTINVDIP
nr:DUF3244 domain-containing protein [Microbacter margulisiae]